MNHQSYMYQPAFEYEQQPPEFPPSPTSKKVTLTLLLILPFLFLVATLILFICFLVSQQHQTSSESMINAITVTSQLKNDLSHPLIKSITAVQGECAGTTKELYFGEFPGVEKGCVCKEGNEWVEAEDSQCKSSTNCKMATGIEANKLKTLFNGYKLCYIEVPSTDYIYGTKEDCDKHATLKKFCKSGVCMEDLDNCPINTAYLYDELIQQGVDLKAGEVFLNFQNSFDLTPLIRFQLGYSSYCLNTISFDKLKSGTDYPLLGKQYSGCDTYQNYETQGDAFKIKDTKSLFSELNYQKTLALNSIPYTDNEKSPYYKDYIEKYHDKDEWNFYQINRPKVGSSAICSANKGFDNLSHIFKVSTSILQPLYIFTLFGLGLTILGLIIWIGLLLVSYISKQSKKNSKRMTQYLKLSHIIAVLIALFLIFIFIYYMCTMSGEQEGIETSQSGFAKAISSNCYQDTKGFKDAINVVQGFNYFILETAYSFILTFFILALIYLVLFALLSLVCMKFGESPFLAPYAKHN